MKAAEVLRLYQAGQRDFQGESLRGQNFKGKDLSGADFSGADIRSTNFSNVNLSGSKFVKARAGLQRRWAVGLVVLSLLLSAVSGFFSAFTGYVVLLIFNSGNSENQVGGWISLAIIVVFLFLLLCKGLVSAVETIAGAMAGVLAIAGAGAAVGVRAAAVAGTVAGTGTVAGAGTVAIAIAGIAAVAGAETAIVAAAIATVIAAAVAAAVTGTGVAAVTVDGAGIAAVAVAGSVAAGTTLGSAYVGLRVLKGDKRDDWIRSVAIVFAAIRGTSFRGATLTDADFSQARLKSTDFRRAVLYRTCWRDADKLDRVRPGDTYLHKPKIRYLVRTGNGQGQSYDHYFDLRGINLQGANLATADFSGSVLKYGTLQGANLVGAHFKNANLNYINLQDADLTDAKLIQTQLNQADLTGATLTGAYIEDWGITTTTNLHGIQCDYVFMRLPREKDSDPNPHRKPDDWNRTFADGEFVDFIAPMVETLDLYHNQTVDPRAVAIAFSDLRRQNPDTDLEIISMEKRGPNLDKFNLRVRTSDQVDLSQLHHQYFERYEHLLTLPPPALVALLMEKEEKSQMLAGMVGTAINRPRTHINNIFKGDTNVSEQGSNSSKYDMRGAQFAGGFAETVQGNQIGGTINNTAAETPSLTEAAAEIQTLLQQLEASNPAATEADQTAFLNVMIPPTRRARFVGALEAASGAAIEEVPYGAVLKALVEGWQRPNG